VKNIKIPIKINLTVIKDQPVWKIIPRRKKAVPPVSIIPAACILENTSGSLISPHAPIIIDSEPTKKHMPVIMSKTNSIIF
jgi:hypothetical protein